MPLPGKAGKVTWVGPLIATSGLEADQDRPETTSYLSVPGSPGGQMSRL